MTEGNWMMNWCIGCIIPEEMPMQVAFERGILIYQLLSYFVTGV